MSEVWSTVVVASISIVGILITQVLSSKALRDQMTAKSRYDFLKEGYKDNLSVWHALGDIQNNQNIEENIKTVQQIVDKSPESLSHAFLILWSEKKDELRNQDKNVRMGTVGKFIECNYPNMLFYSRKYFKQALGFNQSEINEYFDAMNVESIMTQSEINEAMKTDWGKGKDSSGKKS